MHAMKKGFLLSRSNIPTLLSDEICTINVQIPYSNIGMIMIINHWITVMTVRLHPLNSQSDELYDLKYFKS